jgi:ribose transport system substrate-binding protein
MRKRRWIVGLATAALLAGACSNDADDDTEASGDTGADDTEETAPDIEGGTESEFFSQAEMDAQLAMRDAEPEGPADMPWEQAIEPEFVDTAEFAQPGGGWNVCFSNAAVDNPWRQVGWKTMQAEVELHPEIADFTVLDAEASDDKQISDIESLTGQGCDALIISPNTTATLTPAVEAACETGVPVIVFDRGVNTDCPVTFIKPIGGYAFGADAAEFLVDEVEPGGKILALRILPGVDVLETRFAAAQQIFEDSELELVGAEFSEGDAANTKNIVSDYIQREGQLDGIWMDAGATALAAIEAFEDAGVEVPPITGEDQQDFLQKWADDDLTAVAPTYPTYQWRTPIIAAVRILSGEQVPAEWNLPQPLIAEDNLQDYLQPDMPPLHYALCGCEDMPGFPQDWQ